MRVWVVSTGARAPRIGERGGICKTEQDKTKEGKDNQGQQPKGYGPPQRSDERREEQQRGRFLRVLRKGVAFGMLVEGERENPCATQRGKKKETSQSSSKTQQPWGRWGDEHNRVGCGAWGDKNNPLPTKANTPGTVPACVFWIA